jgi:dienelactone hydrolase
MTDSIPRDIRPAFPIEVPRDGVAAKFRELIGLDEVPREVDFTVGASKEEDGLLLTGVSFRNSLGETVPAKVLRPLDTKTEVLAGAVCMPGTGGTAEEVIAKRLYRPIEPRGPLVGWGRELARRGYAVLAFSQKGTEVRRRSKELWEEEAKLLAPYARPQIGVMADEALRASLVLGTIGGVDPERIGLTGMSLGGVASWVAMSCGPWIRTAAAVCGVVGTLEQVIHSGQVQRHSSYLFIPHMLRYFDHPEIVAECIAPRPFMMVAPTEDDDMPKEGVDQLVRVVAPVYESAGQPERFKVHRPRGIHTYRTEYFEWVVEWFDEYLARDSG